MGNRLSMERRKINNIYEKLRYRRTYKKSDVSLHTYYEISERDPERAENSFWSLIETDWKHVDEVPVQQNRTSDDAEELTMTNHGECCTNQRFVEYENENAEKVVNELGNNTEHINYFSEEAVLNYTDKLKTDDYIKKWLDTVEKSCLCYSHKNSTSNSKVLQTGVECTVESNIDYSVINFHECIRVYEELSIRDQKERMDNICSSKEANWNHRDQVSALDALTTTNNDLQNEWTTVYQGEQAFQHRIPRLLHRKTSHGRKGSITNNDGKKIIRSFLEYKGKDSEIIVKELIDETEHLMLSFEEDNWRQVDKVPLINSKALQKLIDENQKHYKIRSFVEYKGKDIN
ncbi:uncharacterized protein [Parasteatoda tepidariorum]|uniref:uncharacterized protein isoform X1 n=1 Tax=Parasteatoda tepidariorum TaxID=114398 RepID=UPI001C71E2B2|nr:uncharacterized protein LOC107445279 isoform X1 [Parasteatoda tepidariorum]